MAWCKKKKKACKMLTQWSIIKENFDLTWLDTPLTRSPTQSLTRDLQQHKKNVKI